MMPTNTQEDNIEEGDITNTMTQITTRKNKIITQEVEVGDVEEDIPEDEVPEEDGDKDIGDIDMIGLNKSMTL